MKKITLITAATIVYCILVTANCFSQGTAINSTGAAADNSAMLDVSDTSRGILIPRMTESQKNAIVSPAKGLMVYNISTDCFNFYNGSQWEQQCGQSSSSSSNMVFSFGANPSAVSTGSPANTNHSPITLTATFVSGDGSPVGISLSGVPSGVTYSLTPSGGYPNFTSTLIFYVGAGVAAASYPITITASGGVSDQTAVVDLVVLGVAKRVFTSSNTYNANLGGVTGANDKCQTMAGNAGLSGTYFAWVSTSTSDQPATRFTKNPAPYCFPNGDLIAFSWADLTDSTLMLAPTINEYGQTNISYDHLWSCTYDNGKYFPTNNRHCTQWTSQSGSVQGAYGAWANTGNNWSYCCLDYCSIQGRIFCVEQ